MTAFVFTVAVVTLTLMIMTAHSFTALNSKWNSIRSFHSLSATVEAGSTAEIPAGERKLLETDKGTIVVANVDGSFYAVNAKCPHLGLPMKKGAIAVENGTPVITCNFHNSKFSLEDGSCKSWCTGVLGLPGTGFFASVSGKFGGEANSPATTYPVSIVDGKIFVDL